MTTHVLKIDRRMIRMTVSEPEYSIVCVLTDLTLVEVDVATTPEQRNAHYDHVYAWFTAIVSDLRANSNKTIHLFDRQHVMTT